MKKRTEAYGLGRTRSSDPQGAITKRHCNPYTNCIHTNCGGGWKNMEVLVIEVYEETTDNKDMTEQRQQMQLPPELEGKDFRIRKLTPRECFRLMDVDDEDIDRIQATGLSNSAQYKLAGNSIVVNVLFHLFRKLLIEPGPEEGDHTARL